MNVEVLVTRIEAVVWRIERGEYARLKELAPLIDAAEGLAPVLDRPEIERLQGKLERARAVLEAARAKDGERAHEAKRGRRALRGFATFGQGDRRTPR